MGEIPQYKQRTEEELLNALQRFIDHKSVMSIPVDLERNADIILGDGIRELADLRRQLAQSQERERLMKDNWLQACDELTQAQATVAQQAEEIGRLNKQVTQLSDENYQLSKRLDEAQKSYREAEDEAHAAETELAGWKYQCDELITTVLELCRKGNAATARADAYRGALETLMQSNQSPEVYRKVKAILSIADNDKGGTGE